MARRAKEPALSVDEQLAALEQLPADRALQVTPLKAALDNRHYRVVAKAARLAEDGLFYDLLPDLLAAYPRFLDKPLKSDPNCLAKKALARSLVALDCDDPQFYVRGLHYRQPEPVWGGTRDTAAELRSACAMGLVGTGYPRALVLLTALLNDSEAEARLGAARAIACGNPREAELLLRSRALAGDAEPGVLGECFTGLLAVEPDESVAFVAEFLSHADEAVRELAALALGESRLDAALPPLQQAWHGVLVSETLRRTLLRAITAHRSEQALQWLLELVVEARAAMAVEIIEALALYKHNAKLAENLSRVLEERDERALLERFAELWQRGT